VAENVRSPRRNSSEYLEGLGRLIGRIEQLPAVLWSTDTALRFTTSAGRGLAALGLRPGQVVGQTLYEYFGTPDPRFPPIAAHLRALLGESVDFEQAFDDHVFATQVVPMRGADGTIEGTLGIAIDITDIKRTQEALRHSESHYRALVEGAPVGIFRSTAGGRFVVVNPALVRMLGYGAAEEVLALDLDTDVYAEPEHRARATEHFSRPGRAEGLDVVWRRRDGSRITVRLTGQPVHDADGRVEGWEMVAEDVTERRRLEAQLQMARKMEALGLVTGGVAHDFNNLLTTIVTNAELIASALPASFGQSRSDLLEIQDAASRGAALVKKLLGFSRRERLSMHPTDLGPIVADMSEVLRRLAPERIRISHEVEPDLPKVMADAGSLQQILLSLATNARDAIAEQGTIVIEARRTHLDQAHVDRYGWGKPGEYVRLTVRDSGLGMDEATRERVFEPFFTTKPPGSGSGLGLAMVYGLMKQQNGFVGIESAQGAGTTVALFLPLATGRTTPTARRPKPGAGGELVLVVEDEEPIRKVARRVLERHGYRVLVAADGLEALGLFRDHESEIALILTDVVMPRLGGRGLYDTLRGAGKQVPMVFMSGYAPQDEVPEGDRLEPLTHLLLKPFSVDQLVAAVRQELGSPA
jgi:two-component system cell cycle sensor histidine kinase/response regulator CckA